MSSRQPTDVPRPPDQNEKQCTGETLLLQNHSQIHTTTLRISISVQRPLVLFQKMSCSGHKKLFPWQNLE
ncbi:hypothetical protein RDI58_010346 [Solanum bulbocastanum]|uniref:Uncharacterized protein n=1 Tax=Solanum bulbocastanum TaxID=147425 RepID=A0AAN8TQC7_SOLBU